MLNWIRRKLINRRRAIFRYWDGTRMRAIDPMVAYRSLLEHSEFDWESTPLLIEAPQEAVAAGAVKLTSSAVRDAFDVPELSDNGGLTEWECVELLQVFVESMLALKKNTSDTPTSPEPTEPQSLEESATRPSWGCGSTSCEPNTAAPTAS